MECKKEWQEIYLAVDRSADKMFVINRMKVESSDEICVPTHGSILLLEGLPYQL